MIRGMEHLSYEERQRAVAWRRPWEDPTAPFQYLNGAIMPSGNLIWKDSQYLNCLLMPLSYGVLQAFSFKGG